MPSTLPSWTDTNSRRARECTYAPMVELLRYLEAHGFTNYIASGGDRDFMRVVTAEIYGIPAERVIGTSNALCYTDDGDCGEVAYLAKPDVFDDGPAKPVRIWSRIGRQGPRVRLRRGRGEIARAGQGQRLERGEHEERLDARVRRAISEGDDHGEDR